VQHVLKNPIKRESGDMLTMVTIREQHTLGDWLWIEANLKRDNPLERSTMAIARFAGLSRGEVEQLSMDDYYAIVNAGADDAAKKE